MTHLQKSFSCSNLQKLLILRIHLDFILQFNYPIIITTNLLQMLICHLLIIIEHSEYVLNSIIL